MPVGVIVTVPLNVSSCALSIHPINRSKQFMKLSKTSLTMLAAAGLLSISPVSNAQVQSNKPSVARPGAGLAGRALEARLRELTTRLKLTEEQAPKVKAILEEQDKKHAELRSAGTVPMEERRAKLQAINEETTKKMKEVLTAEQFAKYEELAKQQRNRRQGGGFGVRPAAPGAAPEGAPGAKPADAKK